MTIIEETKRRRRERNGERWERVDIGEDGVAGKTKKNDQ